MKTSRFNIFAASLLLSVPAMAGTINTFVSSATTSLSNNPNWSVGVAPVTGSATGSYTDVLINSTATALNLSSANMHVESLNVTNGSSYTFTSTRTTASGVSPTEFRVGTTGGSTGEIIAPFTNAVSGVAQDLIYLSGNSNLTIAVGSHTSAATVSLRQNGNFNISSGSTLTIAGPVVSNTTSTLSFTGAGTSNLNGNNTYTGSTTVSAGTVNLAGTQTSVGYTVSGGTLNLNGNATSTSSSNTTTVSGGTLNLNANTAGTGATAISGSGTMNMTGTSGSTAYTISGGNLSILASNRIADAASITVSGGTFAIGAFNDTVGAVSISSGSITSSTGVLTSNTSFASTDGGTISAILAGNGALSKSGNGTLILSAANTFTGGTTINGGTLRLDNAAALSTTAGTIKIKTGGILQYGTGVTTDYSGVLGSNVASQTLNIDTNGNNVSFASNVGSGTLTSTTFTKLGAGKLTLNGTASKWDGATTISGGTLAVLSLGNGGAGGTSTGLGRSSNIAANLVLDGGTLQTIGSIGNSTTDRLFTLTQNGGGFDSSGTGSGMILNNTGAIAYTGTGARTLTLSGSTSNGGNGNGTLAATLADGTGGATALTKSGIGTWTLLGANNYTGTTTIGTGGTLQVGDGTTTGSIASSANVVNNGTLAYNLGADQTYANVISGSGGLTKTGAGTLFLTNAANTYTGATAINGGILNVSTFSDASANGGLGNTSTTPSYIAINGGTLQHTAANVASTTRRFQIGLAGATIDSSAALATNTLSFTSATALGITGTGTHQLTLTGTNTGVNQLTSSLADSNGATNVVKSGAGKWVFTNTNANAYTGSTAVNAGTLLFNGVKSGAGTVTVASTATIGGSSSVAGNTTIQNGGTLNAGGTKDAAGKLTFSNDLTYDSGSIFSWDLASNGSTGNGGTRGTTYDAVDVGGSLSINAATVFKVIQTGTTNFTDAFWTASHTWTDIFSVTGTTTSGWSNAAVAVYDTAGAAVDITAYGAFTVNGSTLNYDVVPEPTSALAGLLLGAGLLRRKREKGC